MTRRHNAHDQGHVTETEYLIIEELVKEGASNEKIAKAFVVEPESVKFHISNLLSYSGTTNRTALALWWIREGRYEYLNSVTANA